MALTALTLIASVVTYGASLVFSRVLTPEGFGDLTALLALAVVIAIPTAAAQTRIAQEVASAHTREAEGRIRFVVRYALSHLGVLAAVATLVYLIMTPWLTDWLSLQAIGPALALAPLIFLTFLFPVVLGALQGFERHVAFGMVVLAMAVSRLAVGVPWAEAGGGAGGAILGQAIGLGFAFALGLWLIRAHLIGKGTGAARQGAARPPSVRSLNAGLSFLAFALLSNLDVLLAKVYLDPENAGLYSALSNIAKIMTFVPAAVTVLVVPRITKEIEEGGSGARALRVAAAINLAIAAPVLSVFLIAPSAAVQVMFGNQYLAATPGVRPMALAGVVLSLLSLLVVYTVTIRAQKWALLLVAGIAIQATCIALAHESATTVAYAQLVAMLLILALNEAVRTTSLLKGRTE